MKNCFLFITLAFVHFPICLNSPSHIQTAEKETYFAELKKIHESIKEGINKLTNDANDTQRNIASMGYNSNIKKSILEDSALTQRQMIKQVIYATKLPLHLKTWDCKNLTQKQIDSYNENIEKLKKQAETAKQTVSNEADCQRTDEIKSDVGLLQTYIKQLKEQGSNTCDPPKPEPLPEKFISNLSKNNWIYGNTDKSTYQKNIEELKKTNTLEICPQDKPFIINQVCSSCDDKNVYNIESNKCDQCSEGTVLLNNKCVSPKQLQKVPNLQSAQNWIYGDISPEQYKKQIKQLEEKNQSQVCPPQTPFVSENDTCIDCVDQIYKISDGKCIENCAQGTVFSEKDHQCKNVVYLPNFSKNNWIYGTTTKKQYDENTEEISKVNQVQKCPQQTPYPAQNGLCFACDKIYDISTGECVQCLKQQKFNQTTHICENKQCPEDNPFYNGKNCINCNAPGQFNNFSLKCECPEGTGYENHSGSCLPNGQNIYNSNSGGLNYIGEFPSYNPLVQNCPDQKPYFDGQNCLSCETTSYFDFNTKTCIPCDEGMIFDIATKKCLVPTPVSQKFNSNLEDNITNYCCGQPAPFDNSLLNCPKEKPFFDLNDCIACNQPFYFNFTSLKCSQCQEELIFNLAAKQCKKNEKKQIIYISSQTLNKEGNYYGQPPQITAIEGQQIRQCPGDDPYFNGKQCMSCKLPEYFNFQTKKCQFCSNEEDFNIITRLCQKKIVIPNKFNSNLGDKTNFIGIPPPYESNQGTCPTERPFFNEKQCQSCEMPSYFNFNTHQCEVCPLQNQFFNLVNQQCEVGTQKYVTDIRSDRIYYNGEFQKVISNVSKKKKGDPSIQTCPSDRPFYDAKNDKCINCEGQQSLFNYKYNSCTQCKKDSTFEPSMHICVYKQSVDPTIERMLMNAFNWI